MINRSVNPKTGEIVSTPIDIEGSALAAAKQYLELQGTIKSLEKPLKLAQDVVRSYVTNYNRLTDGESVEAFIQVRKGPARFDLRRMAKDSPELVVFLAAQGLLQVDNRAFDAVAPCVEIDQAARHRMPGVEMEALIIKPIQG